MNTNGKEGHYNHSATTRQNAPAIRRTDFFPELVCQSVTYEIGSRSNIELIKSNRVLKILDCVLRMLKVCCRKSDINHLHHHSNQVVFVVGPTASGKSKLAIEICKYLSSNVR